MAQSNKKAKSPYNVLLSIARNFILEAQYRKTIVMYTNMCPDKAYSWEGVYHRMMAAEKLGHEVLIKPAMKEGHFQIIFREKFPEVPSKLRY